MTDESGLYFNTAKESERPPRATKRERNPRAEAESIMRLHLLSVIKGSPALPADAIITLIRNDPDAGFRAYAELLSDTEFNLMIAQARYKVGEPTGRSSNGRQTSPDKLPAAMEWRPLSSWSQKTPRWLLPNRIPRGELALVAGDPETLKTTLCLNIAARLTTGAEWPLGEGRAEIASVLWIGVSENDPSYVLLPRFRAAGGDPDKLLVHWHTVEKSGDKRPFTIKLDVDALGEKIRAARSDGADVKLIVVDPITEFLGDVDSWKDDQVRRVVGPLIQLAKDEDLTILAIMHPRKATDIQRVLTNIAGSGVWGWISRAVTFTKRLEDERGRPTDEFVWLWEKASLSRGRPAGIKYKIGECPVAPVNDGDETITSASFVEFTETTDLRLRELLSPLGRRTTAKDEAVDWLAERLRDGPVDAKVMAEEAEANSFSPTTMKRAKSTLGVISRRRSFDGGWEWVIPDNRPLHDAEHDFAGPVGDGAPTP